MVTTGLCGSDRHRWKGVRVVLSAQGLRGQTPSFLDKNPSSLSWWLTAHHHPFPASALQSPGYRELLAQDHTAPQGQQASGDQYMPGPAGMSCAPVWDNLRGHPSLRAPERWRKLWVAGLQLSSGLPPIWCCSPCIFYYATHCPNSHHFISHPVVLDHLASSSWGQSHNEWIEYWWIHLVELNDQGGWVRLYTIQLPDPGPRYNAGPASVCLLSWAMKFLNSLHSAAPRPVDSPFLKHLLSRKIDILSTFCNSHSQCVKWGEIISPPLEHHRSQLRQQVAVCSVSAWDIAQHHEYSVTLSKARATFKSSFLWKFLSWALCTQQRDAPCPSKFQLICSASPPKEGSLLAVHLTALSTGPGT